MPENESFDITQIFRKLLPHWKTFCIWGLCAAVAGVALSFTVPRTYQVTSKVAPELSLRTSSLTTLATIAGVNGMSMLGSNNDAMLPTVYPEIVSSVPFLTNLFSLPVKDTTTLYYFMLKETKSSVLGTVLSLPGRTLGAVSGLFIKDDSKGKVSGLNNLDNFHLTKEQNSICKSLSKAILVDVDKRNFLVTITVTMQDPSVAAIVSRAVIDNLKKTVTEYRTGKLKQNVTYLQAVFNDAKDDYFRAQKRFADYADSHQSFSRQGSQIEKQKLQNEAALKYQIYSSVAQQLQQAEVSVQLEAPVFAEVTPPTIPLRKCKPLRSRYLMGFMFLGLCAAFVKVNRKEKIVDIKNVKI